MTPASVVVTLASSPSPSPSPTLKVDPDRVTPGLLGFLAVVLLGVAVFFLWRSLNRQVAKVDFDEKHNYTRARDRASYDASRDPAPPDPTPTVPEAQEPGDAAASSS